MQNQCFKCDFLSVETVFLTCGCFHARPPSSSQQNGESSLAVLAQSSHNVCVVLCPGALLNAKVAQFLSSEKRSLESPKLLQP